jgi:hypothetical protein
VRQARQEQLVLPEQRVQLVPQEAEAARLAWPEEQA